MELSGGKTHTQGPAHLQPSRTVTRSHMLRGDRQLCRSPRVEHQLTHQHDFSTGSSSSLPSFSSLLFPPLFRGRMNLSIQKSHEIPGSESSLWPCPALLLPAFLGACNIPAGPNISLKEFWLLRTLNNFGWGKKNQHKTGYPKGGEPNIKPKSS